MATINFAEFIKNPTLSQLDKCKKNNLCVITDCYDLPVSCSLVESGTESRAVGWLDLEWGSNLASSCGVSWSGCRGLAVCILGGALLQSSGKRKDSVTPAVQSDGEEEKMFTLPQFVPFSAESSHGSQLEAQLTERVAHLQLEKEERECELQLRRELEFRKLEQTPLLGCASWSCWKAQFALLAVNSR